MTDIFIVFLSAVAAGVIQAVTGFGSGVFMMIFFPMILPMLQASALSTAIALAMTLGMTISYRHYICKQLLLFPGILYIAASGVAISLAARMSVEPLVKAFGIFLIILAIYFFALEKKIHVQANPKTAGVCAVLAGAADGLFGIGGPPMVIYYLAALQKKEEYLGTIQAFFFATGIYTVGYRIFAGIYTKELIPLTVVGMIAIIAGKKIGGKIIDKINTDTMRKLVYIFLAFTGILNVMN